MARIRGSPLEKEDYFALPAVRNKKGECSRCGGSTEMHRTKVDGYIVDFDVFECIPCERLMRTRPSHYPDWKDE